jgi:hypothetical protein
MSLDMDCTSPKPVFFDFGEQLD